MPEMKLSGEKYFYGFFYADIEPRNETEYLIGRPITFAGPADDEGKAQ